MEYRPANNQNVKIKPRLIIHGGAGNIRREDFPPEKYQAYRDALISIVSRSNKYMTAPVRHETEKSSRKLPSALEVATYAMVLLEDNPLFNSGHGAVFTRDGINELEASIMVSRGYKKRGVGVMGLRRVRNPILLAKEILERGEDDLSPRCSGQTGSGLDVPSAQGHSQLWGETAEKLAADYGLGMADPSYFFTQRRWDEHIRALERERSGNGSANWCATEFLPQGTCGTVALDEDGVICVATSTGGMTNKLTGRVGDTPTLGAGFWAEEWTEKGDPTGRSSRQMPQQTINPTNPRLMLGNALREALAECFPAPSIYIPLHPTHLPAANITTTRSMAGSGTGNGDSFLRTNALRTVAAMARWKPESSAEAVRHVAGPDGELQNSAGDRWGRTGEGEGGIVGIECAVVRDAAGVVCETRSEILMGYNCGGMFRAWIDDNGGAVMSIWSNGSADKLEA